MDRIFHTPVGEPTYLDTLPVDVIRHHLMPFLDWEDRIHVNRLTPPADRTLPNKIPKDRIIAHQMYISSRDMYSKLRRAYGYRGSMKKTIAVKLNFLRYVLKDHNIFIARYSLTFREQLHQKLVEFSDPEVIRRIRLIAQRTELNSLVSSLMGKLAELPFSHYIQSEPWLTVAVTQNETSLFRREGEIYTVWV
jgi:hypothetical protein